MPRVAVLQEGWLTPSDVGADEIAVMAVLALHANKSGSCWPTQGLIARMLGRSRPWVNKVIGTLVELGLVVKTNRSRDDGGDRACLYQLVAPENAVVHGENTGCRAADSITTNIGNKQDTHAPPTSEIIQLDLKTPETDWQPSDDDLCWALDRFPNADLQSSVERFVMRCQAKGYRYRNLGAAWRSWLADDQRNGGRFGVTRPGYSGGRSSAAQAKFDTWATVAARAGSAHHGT